MDSQEQLAALLDLAESVGIRIRWRPASSSSGEQAASLIRLRNEEMLFLDGGASVGDQIDAVAAVLAGREDLQNRFLPPAIRHLLDQAGLSSPAPPAGDDAPQE